MRIDLLIPRPRGSPIFPIGCGTRSCPNRRTTLINVALAVQAPLLHDVLLELLAAEPDISLMDYSVPGAAAPLPRDQGQPDVVILASRDPEDEGLPVQVLFHSPGSRVLALTTDARRSFLYELRPHRTCLGELSREALLAAVRGANGAGNG